MYRKSTKIVLIFLSFLVALLPANSFCDDLDEDHGRLADGRAFRKDADGIQLVDYIAELEQSVVELNRKVISLEDENSSVKAELERARDGRAEQIQEKDLFKRDTEKDSWQQNPKELAQAESCPPQKECPVTECPSLECPVVEPVALECPEPQVEYKAVSDPNDLDKIESLRKEISRLENQLIISRREKDNISANLQTVSLEAKNCKNKMDNEIRASIKPDLQTSRTQAIDLVRARLNKECQLLVSRKDERDVLFAKYVKEYKGVTLKPSSLIAKSGHDLKEINEMIVKAESIRELALLRNDLDDIRRQMADDLALVERIGNRSRN